MAGTFPTTPRLTSVSLESRSQTLISFSQSGRRNVRQAGAQRWKMKGSYSNLTRAQFMPVWAFLMDQEGQWDTFDFVIPDLATPQGTGGGTPLVNGASQTGKSIITDGWNNSETVFLAGDIFKFTGHQKVYMITSDVTSDGSGNATLNFMPALNESPAENEALIVTAVPFRVQQAASTQSYTARNPLLYNFEVSFVEVI